MSLVVFTPFEALKAITANPSNLHFSLQKSIKNFNYTKYIHVTLTAKPRTGKYIVTAPLLLFCDNIEFLVCKNVTKLNSKLDIDMETCGSLGEFYVLAEKLLQMWLINNNISNKLITQHKTVYDESCNDYIAGKLLKTPFLRLSFENKPYNNNYIISQLANKPQSVLLINNIATTKDISLFIKKNSVLTNVVINMHVITNRSVGIYWKLISTNVIIQNVENIISQAPKPKAKKITKAKPKNIETLELENVTFPKLLEPKPKTSVTKPKPENIETLVLKTVALPKLLKPKPVVEYDSDDEYEEYDEYEEDYKVNNYQNNENVGELLKEAAVLGLKKCISWFQ